MPRQRSESVRLAEEADMQPHAVDVRIKSQYSSRVPQLRRGPGAALLFCVITAHTLAGAHAESAQSPVKLMSGQLTWAIDPHFAQGTREVTFTLLTAFEMDPNCNYMGGVVNCTGSPSTDHGTLCVDEFQMQVESDDDRTFTQLLIGQSCAANEFEIASTRHINGLNIVFGKFVHTVQAKNKTISMLAYFQSAPQSELMLPQCQINITDTALPCAMNVDDLDHPNAPQFKLRKGTGFAAADGFNSKETYWKGVSREQGSPYDFPARPSQNALFFETHVRVCPNSGSQNCKSSESTFHIKNYYSPVPTVPAFVEVAVTSYTQRADLEMELAKKQGWLYNGSNLMDYFAPHPSFQVTSHDLDGHQMAHMSMNWGAARTERYNSNLGLECFSGLDTSKTWPFMDKETETNAAHKHPELRADGACTIFFDMDRSGGSKMKFDFNFGSNVSKGRYYRVDGNYTVSGIFGNDLNRCRGDAGNGMLACDPGKGMPCIDATTGRMSACSGNLMFTHHIINTADLPWMDVDNELGTEGQYTVKQPQWFTGMSHPGSAMVKTLVSAYMCFAGTANQPPRFVKNLEVVPNITDWLRVPGFTPEAYLQPEDTEITCTAGEPCVFPIFAQDFLLSEAGKSCITRPTNPEALDTWDKPMEPCVFAPNEDESARYQSTDVVRIELAPGWDVWDPLDDYEGQESQGADLLEAYCSGGDEANSQETALGCVRDSDCPAGWGTCTGYKRKQETETKNVRPGYCIRKLSGQAITDDPCKTDADCGIDSKCAMPSCESSHMYGKGGAGLGAVKCFYKEYFKARHVGTVHTRCFVATDPQGDRYFNNVTYQAAHPEEPRMWEGQCNKMDVANRPGYLLNSVAIQNPLVPDLPSKVHGCESSPPEHKQGDYARTCKSMPVCFKIKVEGKAPHFVEPTPMQANSYDDDYKLVPGRTDVAACEGYGLELTIKAQDLDGDGVRIFVEDKDEDAAVASLLDKNLKGETYYVLAETYNLDFFNKTTMTFPAAAVGNSAGNNFEPYAAEKVGNNSRQESILPLDSMGAKSIASGYAPEIEYAAVAQQRIEYVLDPREKNGMLVRRASEDGATDPQNCMVGDNNATVHDNRCREKLLNMDQTICAFAYDNSRHTSSRWVGKTDPNGKATQFCTDNARVFGAPAISSAKSYVAGSTGMPWIGECSDENTIPRWMRDHSNGDMASPMHCWRIQLQAPPIFVTDPYKIATPFPLDYDLSAFDGTMAVSLEMAVTPVIALSVGEYMSWTFVAQDPNPKDTVQILILDDPGMPPEMRASETRCITRNGNNNQGQDMFAAADHGWNLPTKMVGTPSSCSKAKLHIDWTPPKSAAGGTYKVCAVAKDSSSACAGIAHPEQATSRGWLGEVQCVEFVVASPRISFDLKGQPQEIDSYVGCTTQFELFAQDCSLGLSPCVGQYGVDIQLVGILPQGAKRTEPEKGVGTTRQYLNWVPRRGMEGQMLQACFTAIDDFATQEPTSPMCVNMTVQKCQYCIDSKDTLSLMMKDYGLDTNWLRVWLHNGNNAPSEATPRVENPDLIVGAHQVSTQLSERMGNSRGQPIVWAGVMYKTGVGQSLATVAARFRTTIAGLLSVNPDVSGEEDVPEKVGTLCVVPCGQRYPDQVQRAA